MGDTKGIGALGASLALLLLSSCSGLGANDRCSPLKWFTPSCRQQEAPRVTLLSITEKKNLPGKPHFVQNACDLSLRLNARPGESQGPGLADGLRLQPLVLRSGMQQRSSRKSRRYRARMGSSLPSGLPSLEPAGFAAAANDFYLTLGTGIVDPEKEASWTSAAVYPIEPSQKTLPAMRINGQTARSDELMQVAPGFFWWPTHDCCLSLVLPVGLTDTAPDWGVLLALRY